MVVIKRFGAQKEPSVDKLMLENQDTKPESWKVMETRDDIILEGIVEGGREACHNELALDILLEKEVVKQSGEAWRIVLDFCLPILHFIDTKRPITYAC